MTPLQAIRIAMLAGVLLFGGVSWFLHRLPDWRPATNLDLGLLRLIARVLLAVGVMGTVVLVWRTRGLTDRGRVNSLASVGWALGEMIALYGGVVFYLTGVSSWYVIGVLFLALTFVALPGYRPR